MLDQLRARWDGLKPYQRELTFAGAFDALGLVLLALAFFVVYLVAPALLATNMLFWTLVGCLGGLGIAVTGQLLGYRIEDRRAARIEGTRRG